MTKTRTDDFGVPEPDHDRAEWLAPVGSVLKKRIAEVRGLRTYRRNIYHNNQLTVIEASLQDDAPDAVLEWLEARANHVLQAAGYASRPELVDALGDTPEAESEALPGFTRIDVALLMQSEDIATRHGFLSREATASHFAALNERMGKVFTQLDERELDMLRAWANAYYWLRFEETGGHGLAYSGAKTLTARKGGPAAQAATAARKVEIVRELFAKLEQGSKTNLDAAVADLLVPVTEHCRVAKLKPYTAKSLRWTLSKLKLVSGAKKQAKGL